MGKIDRSLLWTGETLSQAERKKKEKDKKELKTKIKK